MDYLSDPGRVCYDSRVGLVLGSHVCCSSIRWSGLLPSATVAPESGLGHPGISSGHSPPGMFALSPAPPSLQIQPILPSPSLPFHSWYQPFQNFTCAQSSSKMGIHQPRSWHSSWAETLLCSSSYQAWHPVAVLDNLQRRATPQINFTQICFRCFPKARSKPVNW